MDRASDSGSEGWGFESLPAYQKIQIPIWVSGFFVYAGRGSKDRPERSEGEKHAGGMFFRPWESPCNTICSLLTKITALSDYCESADHLYVFL